VSLPETQPAPVAPAPVAHAIDDLALLLEAALTRPDLTEDDLSRACDALKRQAIAAIIVRPCDIDSAARWLRGSNTQLGALVDTPHGYSTSATKNYAARELLQRGARQIDTVMNTGKLVARQFQYLEMELLQMAEACHQSGALLAVNLESEYLNEELKIVACRIARRAAADYLGSNLAADVPLLQSHSRDRIKIKCAVPSSISLDEVHSLHAAGCARFQLPDPAPLLAIFHSRLADPQLPATSHQ
jgi:deoxyribose-phosphate aldolase